MEEIIAKSARTPHLIIYSITLGISILFLPIGISLIVLSEGHEGIAFRYFIVAIFLFVMIFSIIWLIYFAKMPREAIKFKDGKLYFRNGITCSPTEMYAFTAKSMGIDGALLGFGKLHINVNGLEFKLKYVCSAESVIKKLFMLKAEYSVKEHLANQKQIAEEQNVQEQENKQEEDNG